MRKTVFFLIVLMALTLVISGCVATRSQVFASPTAYTGNMPQHYHIIYVLDAKRSGESAYTSPYVLLWEYLDGGVVSSGGLAYGAHPFEGLRGPGLYAVLPGDKSPFKLRKLD